MSDGPADADGPMEPPGEPAESDIAPPTAKTVRPQSPVRRSPRGWLYAGRSIIALVAIFALFEFGSYWRILRTTDQAIVSQQVSALDTSGAPIPTYSNESVPQEPSETALARSSVSDPPGTKLYPVENILLLGSDTRAHGNGDASDSNATTDDTSQSDTLMIAHVSRDGQHVSILSIPRDTMVPAPTCKTWNFRTGAVSDQSNNPSPGQRYHINNAYAVGGPACTVTAVEELTGVKITRYIGIDFSGFKGMVDALGGITVNICRPIVDQVLGTVEPSAGVQKIQGLNALNLVRARDVIGDSQSDLARIHRQQVVLSTILRQVTQAGTLLNQYKLSAFLKAFTQNTFTDNVNVEDLVTLAGELGDLNPAKVSFYTLPTVPSTITPGALEVNQAAALPLFDDLRNDLLFPGQTASGTTSKAPATTRKTAPSSTAPAQNLTVDPADVDLRIYNLTGTNGVAGQAETALDAVGFKVSSTDLLSGAGTQTGVTVEYSPGNRPAALTVAAAVPGSTLVATAGLGSTVRLKLGTAYAGQVSAVYLGETAPASLGTQATAAAQTGSTSSGSSTATTAVSSVNAASASCV